MKKRYLIILILSLALLTSAVHAETDTWLERAKLLASDGSAGDIFGYSVSTSGDYVIVGAYQDDDKKDMSGSAYIFKRDGTNWVQQQKLLASDGAESN